MCLIFYQAGPQNVGPGPARPGPSNFAEARPGPARGLRAWPSLNPKPALCRTLMYMHWTHRRRWHMNSTCLYLLSLPSMYKSSLQELTRPSNTCPASTQKLSRLVTSPLIRVLGDDLEGYKWGVHCSDTLIAGRWRWRRRVCWLPRLFFSRSAASDAGRRSRARHWRGSGCRSTTPGRGSSLTYLPWPSGIMSRIWRSIIRNWRWVYGYRWLSERILFAQ